ncbi:hypothetical protein HPB50_028142 [Hyalomma asiaticum]|nr:hypothetical protein HPB50_028142 [Hyalomma asiaticum]
MKPERGAFGPCPDYCQVHAAVATGADIRGTGGMTASFKATMPKAFCAVFSCSSKSGLGVSLHAFPRDESLRQKWIEFVRASGRPNWSPGNNSRICERHFAAVCFSPNPPCPSVPSRPRRWLKHGALPTDARGSHELDGALPKRPRRETSSDRGREPALPPPAGGALYDNGTTVAACQTDFELPDIVLLEETRQRTSTPCPALSETYQAPPITSPELSLVHSEQSFAYKDDPLDNTYEPELNSPDVSVHDRENRKFIVYEDCLLQLCKFCQTCGLLAKASLKVKATLVQVKTVCLDKHVHVWLSQPRKGRHAAGDVALAAAILFTGCSITQSLHFLDNAGVCCFGERTYHRLQRKLLFPAVNKVWQDEKQAHVQMLLSSGGIAKVAGDSRADSPGYSAKYGAYSLLETGINRIIEIKVVQCNEVPSSTHMELEGLKRALGSLEASGVHVKEVVTDRHPQVRRYFKVEKPDVDHLFDAWHVCKGLNKKLLQAAKRKGCTTIGRWSRSIINHLYFSVQHGGGNADLSVAIWLSLLNHVQDKHHGHSVHYADCQHAELEPREWIFPGTEAFDKLSSLLANKRILDDIRQVVRVQSLIVCIGLNSQSSLLLQFSDYASLQAPKFPLDKHFDVSTGSSVCMPVWCVIAALHFNENADKGQASTKSGELRWRIKHPKARKGEASYVDRLLLTVEGFLSGSTPDSLSVEPPPVSSSLGDVDKTALIQSHLSRFGAS